MKKFIISLLICSPVFAEFVVPATPNPVNDYAGVLDAGAKEQAAHAIVELKKELGVQMGILIVPTLDGSSIEDASAKVMGAWKLGSKDRDDGILLMLSIGDRKSRLEIGRGLEGILTDAQSKEILYNMRPGLASKNYGPTINLAITNIYTQILNNKNDIMVKPKSAESDINGFSGFVIGFFGIMMLGVFGIPAYINRRKRLLEAKLAKQKATFPVKLVSNNNLQRLQQYQSRTYDSRGIQNTTKVTTSSPTKSSNTYVPIPIIVSESSHSSSYDSGSSSSSSSSSDSSSSWSGGGGDFSGGGSSDSW